jgi:undecaprenyl-diphosphatase
MDLFQAIVIAIVEGLTEFLPVSSTAHMIFTSSLFGNQDDEFVKLFQVSIQFGAILAVVVLYYKKFFNIINLKFYAKLAFAVLPALVLGVLFDDYIEAVLEKPVPIAIVLILGGVFLLFIDKIFVGKHKIDDEKGISFKKAIIIGFWQCLAMMPGTSRSAASIIGGMQQGLGMKLAAEFSFFLAVPTMLAVTMYSVFIKGWKIGKNELKGYEIILQDNNLMAFIVGNLVAFGVAMLAISFFIGILKKFGFRIWGWYRIISGIAFLIWYLLYATS